MPAIQSIADDQTRAFAEACYDTNSLPELRDAEEPDEIDMREWGIDEDQWREAVAAALSDLESEMGDAYLLHEVGVALFGQSWQSEMARALGMNDARGVRYWTSGERNVPKGVWSDLRVICGERGRRLIGIAERLADDE